MLSWKLRMWLIYKTISSSLCKANKVNQMHDNLIQGLQRDSRLPFYYCLFKCFQKSVWSIWQTSWTVWIFVCKSATSIQIHMDVTTLQKFWLFKPHSPPPQKFHWPTVGELWIFFGMIHSVFIRYQRLENSPFISQNFLSNVW